MSQRIEKRGMFGMNELLVPEFVRDFEIPERFVGLSQGAIDHCN